MVIKADRKFVRFIIIIIFLRVAIFGFMILINVPIVPPIKYRDPHKD